MSILKLKAQDFTKIDLPRCDTSGSWYLLGYDNSTGSEMLAQMDCHGNITYITGSTILATTSGTSGIAGTAGTSGGGTAGTSGKDGTSGVSVSGPQGSGGTSGINGSFLGTHGTSGTAGTSGASTGTHGTSGSSGVDGVIGTSGTSGNSTSGTSGSSTSGTSGYNGLSEVNSFTWVISDPEVGGVPGPKIYNLIAGFTGYDGLNIFSYISGGTDLTFNIQNRFTDELLVSGTTVYSGITTALTLSGDSSSFFRGLTIPPDFNPTLYQDSWLWLEITSVNGYPDKLLITLIVYPIYNI